MLQSVQTALEIFEIIAKSEPIGVSEIARCHRMSKSTVQRCLKALSAAGWIRADGDSRHTRWIITSKAYILGQRVTQQGHLRQTAMPIMAKLWTSIQESILLTVPESDKTVLLEHYESSNPIRMQIPRGSWTRMHLVPSGKVMLAFSDKKIVDRYCESGLEAMTDKTITDPAQLRKELAKIRKQGWAVSIDELIVGASGAAAPIFGFGGQNIAALAIVLPTIRFPQTVRSRYLAQLVEAAGEITRHLSEY